MANTGQNDALANGKVSYLTGGTTREARVVSYDAARWRQVVGVKAKLLQAHGLGAQARVAVCHPFSPWSVGQVHVEGALLCGCEVVPFGLNAHTPEILHILARLAPTHICGGASYLIRLAKLAQQLKLHLQLPAGGAVFVAGERLEPANRAECETLWGAPVIDVYGMAEFDALGIERVAGAMSLVDDYEYALVDGAAAAPLASGRTGELLIRQRGDTAWHASGDQIRVLSATASGGFAAEVAMLGRLDLTINFSDGSAISETQVQQLAAAFGDDLQALQIQVFRPPGGDIIRAVCVPRGNSLAAIDHAAIRAGVININVDVADSYQQGVIRDCMVDVYPSDRVFVHTARGKRPLLVRME